MTYGAALDLRVSDFQRLLLHPRAPLVGLLGQYVALPAATTAAAWALAVPAPLALAMILVACCPGGNFSNVLTGLARANVALSVSLTAASTVLALVLTPFNFWLYTTLNPSTRALTETLTLDPIYLLGIVFAVLAVPVGLAMWTRRHAATFADRAQPVLRKLSILILTLIILAALALNRDVVSEYGTLLALLIVGHNTGALLLGAALASLCGLAQQDRRTVIIEVGIQNTGLAVLLLATLAPADPMMLVYAAAWGLPHLVSGLGLAALWGRSTWPRANPR